MAQGKQTVSLQVSIVGNLDGEELLPEEEAPGYRREVGQQGLCTGWVVTL